MSLARLALRLAAVEALSPWSSTATGAYPTPAGPRVYDSRQQPIDGLSDLETKPILIVYTEDHTSEAYGVAKHPPDEDVVCVTVEAMIAAKGTVEVDLPDGTKQTVGTIVSPISDQQQEALLDLLEATVRRVFDTRNRAASSEILTKVAMEVQRIESQPQRADDKTTRLAARTIKFYVKIRPDVWPRVPASGLTGYAVLPAPLSGVAADLNVDSSEAALCMSIVAQIQALQPAPLVPLQSIGIVTDLAGDPTLGDTVESVVLTDPAAAPSEPAIPNP